VPPDRWISFGHQVIWFGRKVCQARKPLCAACPLETVCDSADKTVWASFHAVHAAWSSATDAGPDSPQMGCLHRWQSCG